MSLIVLPLYELLGLGLTPLILLMIPLMIGRGYSLNYFSVLTRNPLESMNPEFPSTWSP